MIAQIASARDQLDEITLARLTKQATDNPRKCYQGLQRWNAIIKLNSLFNLGKKATGAARAAANPLEVLGSIFMSELLDKTVEEKWQHIHQAAEQHKATKSATRPAA